MAERLTPASARAMPLAPPGGRRPTMADHEVTGLRLRANRTGKTWGLYYRTRAGIEREVRVGTFPDLSLDAARRTAKTLKERVARGEDPSRDWRGQKGVLTVAQLCDRYLEEYAKLRRGKAAYKQHEQLIRAYIKPGLGKKLLTEVTRIDVDRFLARVANREFPGQKAQAGQGETAHWSARHARNCLKQLYTVAFEYFDLDYVARNPVLKTMVYERIIRKRLAEPDELLALAGALKRLPELTERGKDKAVGHAACIWALFLTGARVGEMLNARWDQIVLRQGGGYVLHLKKHKTAKRIGEKDIILPPVVYEIINALPRKTARVFDTTKAELRLAWSRVRKAAGCPDLKLLDTRRTFASYALSEGKTLDQVGEALFHTDTQTTKGYAHLTKGARNKFASDVAAAITNAASAPQ